MSHVRPLLVVSACLLGDPVRYDGGTVDDPFVRSLASLCDVIKVCPEVGAGLGVPRARIILFRKEGHIRAFQPGKGVDVTDKLLTFSRDFIERCPEPDGFILKGKSPSCSVSSSAILYQDPMGTKFLYKSKGIFASALLEAYPLLPIVDEKLLKNPEIRQHFVLRVFALADVRISLEKAQNLNHIMELHRRHKYFLMLHSQVALKKMGRFLAEAKGRPLQEVKDFYRAAFLSATHRRPSLGQWTNVFLHIFGHISTFLKPKEKEHFMKLLDHFRQRKIGQEVLLELLRNWAYRFDNNYLLEQSLLNYASLYTELKASLTSPTR
ncbi:protein of unknown function DUF523 [Thermocrinis albus DSM 14484]|uniref:DUF1722 domain-containing protein n=1 Tax=Thermocrinis albus (strain DSM 14484 / JCM 11386 / HI 11/12) TaxID=638303 RepID=D3SP20_THEAH|nr:DUF523 and DUF1722 domain-containing protein [Thermocrinis albus]ADC88907.1 protein of unknown function DUF523 [Thermocrinis albus DSM 14484]